MMDSSVEEKATAAHRWKSGEPFHYKLGASSTQNGCFDTCFDEAVEFDSRMCRRWEQDIDTLLVYAGLFSAAVTTFAVESANSLQQDPQEETVRLLAIIAGQANAEPQEEFQASTASITINVMYFLSLTLSLAAALISILCKQWVREYQREYPHLNPKQKLAVRQSRYEGLQTWRVPGIIALIPLLLQAATALFFFGVVTMLWEANHTVAIVIIIAVILSLLFVITTTLLAPILLLITWATKRPFSSQCAYKTPLGWTIIRIATPSFLIRYRLLPRGTKNIVQNVESIKKYIRTLNWSMYDMKFVDGDLYEGCMSAAMIWQYPFKESGAYSECIRVLSAQTSWGALKKLIPFLKTAREHQTRTSLESGSGEDEGHAMISAEVLENFVSYVYGTEVNGETETNEEVKKDVIDMTCVLFRRNAPRNEKIRYCLEGCVRIVNTARVLPPRTLDVARYLLHTHTGPLDKNLGYQLDTSFDAALHRGAIQRPEYDNIKMALSRVYPVETEIQVEGRSTL